MPKFVSADLGFSAEEAMIQSGRRRLRPIMMTALATVAGMLPLAFAFGAGSQMLQPLAIAVIGGLFSSMVLSLVFTPAIHHFLHRRTSRRKQASRSALEEARLNPLKAASRSSLSLTVLVKLIVEIT